MIRTLSPARTHHSHAHTVVERNIAPGCSISVGLHFLAMQADKRRITIPAGGASEACRCSRRGGRWRCNCKSSCHTRPVPVITRRRHRGAPRYSCIRNLANVGCGQAGRNGVHSMLIFVAHEGRSHRVILDIQHRPGQAAGTVPARRAICRHRLSTIPVRVRVQEGELLPPPTGDVRRSSCAQLLSL